MGRHARICGVILELKAGRSTKACKPLHKWFGMTHSTSTGTSAGTTEPAAGHPGSAGDDTASPELPLERSRFSSWLASFGLGETTIPLLRPLKSPRLGR